jgi:hypothetical protein
VEAIKLNTKLGNCNLKVSAQLQNDDKAMKLLGEFAMQYLIWHVIPAGAFNKKSDYKRDSEYSDGLSKHLVSEGKSVLGKVFKDISIETSKYDAPDKIAKLIKQYMDIGLSEADAKVEAMKIAALVAKPKTETSTEVETPTDAVESI